MNLKIYVGYHKMAPIIKSAHVVPVHLGAHGKTVLPEMIGDNTGQNISAQNDIFCELTALYWAWKNDKISDYIGLMHYRRLVNFHEDADPITAKSKPPFFAVDTWLKAVANFADKGPLPDIIVPPMHHMSLTVEANYSKSHDVADFDLARTVIQRSWPEYSESFEEVAAKRSLRLGNIVIMHRTQLDAYCTWLFDILFQVNDLRHGPETYFRPRFAGHLAERLLTTYIHHLEKTRPDLWIAERPILKLSNSLILPFSRELSLTQGNPVNLALSCDNSYLPYAAAMLTSVIKHMPQERQLNIIWMHDDVPEPRVWLLRDMVLKRPNTYLIDVNTAHYFADGYRSDTRMPSNATYNRFLLFRLFPALKRVLYLDCDIIAMADICPLFDSDLGGKTIGAVPDWIMTRTLTGKVCTADPLIPDLLRYQQDMLGLSPSDISTYVNAGVLLIDMSTLQDPETTGEILCDRARTNRCLFRDQDILNAAFAGNIAQLDARWNVFNSPAECYARLPIRNYEQAMAARREPWIIHYADRDHKPWYLRSVPEAQHFWQALIQTPFYGELLGRTPPKRRWKLRLPIKRWWRKLSRKIHRRFDWKRPLAHPSRPQLAQEDTPEKVLQPGE